jgi:hypothetical protein
MRQASAADRPARHNYDVVFDAGVRLFKALKRGSPDLAALLAAFDLPRRLVIASDQAEIHRLPWEAMIDERGRSVAQGGLSVVHACANTFERTPHVSAQRLQLAAHFGPNTNAETKSAIAALPSDPSSTRGLFRTPGEAATADDLRKLLGREIDIVHIEAHGNEESSRAISTQTRAPLRNSSAVA